MVLKTYSTAVVAWLVVFTALGVAAQTDQARLMGMVTDGSGGALPGVTVTVQSPDTMRPRHRHRRQRVDTSRLADARRLQHHLCAVGVRDADRHRRPAGRRLKPWCSISSCRSHSSRETVEVTAPAPPPPPPPAPLVARRRAAGQACRQGNARLGVRSPPVAGLQPRDRPRRVTSRRSRIASCSDPAICLRIDAGERQGVVRRPEPGGEAPVPDG